MKNKIIISISAVILVAAGTAFYVCRPASGLNDFAALTREDPLFYSPFFDTNAFSVAVDSLEKSEESLKESALRNISLSKENYVDSYTKLIKETPLFPTDFLSLLPEISKETESFKAQPAPRKARHLLSLYEKAQNAYEKDAKAMTEAYADIDKHIPDDKPVYYFFTQSATSVQTAQEDFDLIYKNSMALKEEISRRHDCLYGKGSCETPSEGIKGAAEPEKIAALAKPVEATGNNMDLIRETLPFASSTREVSGPYSISSPCWGASSAQPMYAVYSKNENGQKMILPKLAQESYYRLVSPKATDAISKKLQEMNLQFYGQAEGTTYECSDLSFYPEILALDFIRKQSEAASTTGDEYSQLWQNKFGLLAPALQSLAAFTDILEASQRISDDFVLSPQFLFTTRSAYSITYLPFAQSAWRLDEKPKLLLSQEEYIKLGAPKQFKTLTELKNEGVPEETLKKSQINQKDFINSLAK